MNNTVFLIVGESGSGKTTLVSALEKQRNLKSILSYTTRPSRSDNEYGHIFVNNEAFSQLKNIVAYDVYNGYKYGATAEQVDNHDLYVINPNGVDFFKKAYHGNKQIKVIYIKSPIHTREQRMLERNMDYKSAIKTGDIDKALKIHSEVMERILNDFYEFRDFEKKADLVLTNDDNTSMNSLIIQAWEFIRKELRKD